MSFFNHFSLSLIVLSQCVKFMYCMFLTGESMDKDNMQKLEERARQLAEESVKDQAKPDKGILFVR